MTTIKPLNDYVLVEIMKEENKTASGIITSPSSKDKPWKWKILEIWEGRKSEEWNLVKIENIKKWDIVYFTKYAPEEIEEDWKKYLLIKSDSIIAKQD